MKQNKTNGEMVVNRNATEPLPPRNVTVVMRFARRDRLGSNIQRPLNLMAYAACKGYNFCIPEGRLGALPMFQEVFPICPPKLYDELSHVGDIFETEINQSGIYHFRRDDDSLLRAAHENVECMFNSSFRKKWKEMIYSTKPFRDGDETVMENFFSKAC